MIAYNDINYKHIKIAIIGKFVYPQPLSGLNKKDKFKFVYTQMP